MTDDAKPRPLAVGDRVKDNDFPTHSAMADPVGKVVDLHGGIAAMRFPGRHVLPCLVRVPAAEIHLDDKPRRSGWSRVP